MLKTIRRGVVFTFINTVILGAIVGLIFYSAPSVEAKTKLPKGLAQDKGARIAVRDTAGWPVGVEATNRIQGSIQSFPGMAIIRVSAYKPWWQFWAKLHATTTLSISGLPADTNLYVYTEGYRKTGTYKTTLEGTLSIEQPTGRGIQLILKEGPSTIHIAIDPLFAPPGGDCESVGTWSASTKTCTLTQNVSETITIEDEAIVLDGGGFSVTGTGTGDGIYTDISFVSVRNIRVSNFARGIVFADSFLTHAAGGTVEDVTVSNNTTGITSDGVPSIVMNRVSISGGSTGVSIIDQIDGFPTDNITFTNGTLSGTTIGAFVSGSTVTFTRNNFLGNTVDLSASGSTLTLTGSSSMRGNYWSKFTSCVQDSANPEFCTNGYDAGPANDTAPWACQNAWLSSVTCPTDTPPPTGGGEGGDWVAINSTTDTATTYLDPAKSIKMKDLPNGWVLQRLEEVGTLTKIKDVADNVVLYVETSKVASATDGNSATPISATERAPMVLEAVRHYWSNTDSTNNLYSAANPAFNFSSFVSSSEFPVELFLAILAHESPSDFNNERVTFDYGHGVSQVTTGGYLKDVTYLQELLKVLGHASFTPTGDYKEGTETAVKAFQADKRITQSGNVGPATLAALNTALEQNRDLLGSIPPAFTFRTHLIRGSKDRTASAFDNRGSISKIVLWPCKIFADSSASTANESHKNCYKSPDGGLQYTAVANPKTATPKISYYQNTRQGIYANIKDGLSILTAKYRSKSDLVDGSSHTGPWASGYGVDITNTDLKILLAVRGYNGFGLGARRDATGAITCRYLFDNLAKPLYPASVGGELLGLSDTYGSSIESLTENAPLYKKLKLVTEKRQEICIGSPAYLQVLDANGKITGWNGVGMIDEIPNVAYDTANYSEASILFPIGTYRFRVIGTATDVYDVAIGNYNSSATPQVFKLTDIPIGARDVHEYAIDWSSLDNDSGVTVKIDAGGDGTFEQTITGGLLLSNSDFPRPKSKGAKVTICHTPPGNPDKAHSITIANEALPAHLAHGDRVGECVETNSLQSTSTPTTTPHKLKTKGKK